MANGGGGTVVFGVNNRAVGRAKAILGVPPDVDVNRFKKAVYDSTDPKLTPVFQELIVPEGTGRLIIMQIYPGLPPYTDTGGQGTIRIGKECKPLTGTLRRKIMVETGETDFTAGDVTGAVDTMISASAMERLRAAARVAARIGSCDMICTDGFPFQVAPNATAASIGKRPRRAC